MPNTWQLERSISEGVQHSGGLVLDTRRHVREHTLVLIIVQAWKVALWL